jgi:hypothetical protein
VGGVLQESTPNQMRATRWTPKMLVAILAGIAVGAMLFALVTDLGVWYLIFGVGVGFGVYKTLKRR